MFDTNTLLEYNRRALAIAEAHPLDYHQREDFRTVIDERSEAQLSTERKAPNERPAV